MAAGAVLRDTPGKQPPCLHERIFAGQRTANGFSRELSAVSRGSDGGRDFPYPISCYDHVCFIKNGGGRLYER